MGLGPNGPGPIWAWAKMGLGPTEWAWALVFLNYVHHHKYSDLGIQARWVLDKVGFIEKTHKYTIALKAITLLISGRVQNGNVLE